MEMMRRRCLKFGEHAVVSGEMGAGRAPAAEELRKADSQ